ncbi:MAG TPA: 4-hydroxy-3-methylbut-2-enyl diphosphate reductase [bacterium]|jgi:(E)-4-hydroxy-3-methyl-but-2-enyl pyrophosphate reductase|nr:4-hydroxy-3-methylbut-2-enyl diphosphate reductase [bacterium]
MPRKITVAQAAGFCFGVKKAIDRAEQQDEAYIFGSLIHNPQEVARLDTLGKHIVSSLDDVKGKRVFITAHGLDVAKIQEMKDRDLEIVDTTCPLVTHIYRSGWKMQTQGLRVVIIGDPKHVEVRGIASRMADPIIVYKDEDLEQVPRGSKVGVVSQSTLLLEKFDHFVALLKERCEQVEAINTICKPTKDRQTSAKALSQEVDVMVVIGGYNSSNTHKLAEVAAARLGADNTHHIETAQELKQEWFEGKQHVGVTAGASTPDYLIKEVVEAIGALPDGLPSARPVGLTMGLNAA